MSLSVASASCGYNSDMKKMPGTSESERTLHPLVAEFLQKYMLPSPGRVPSDPEQPRQGCFKELKRLRRHDSARTQAARDAKDQLFKMLKLDNAALNPVVGVKLCLELPKNSSILRRRASVRVDKEPNSA